MACFLRPLFVYPITAKIQTLVDMLDGKKPPPLSYGDSNGMEIERKIKNFIENNELKELNEYISSREFYVESVISSLKIQSIGLPSLWVNQTEKEEFLQTRPKFYDVSTEEIQELSNIVAQQATLVRAGYQIAISQAQEKGITVDMAFQSEEFRNTLRLFVEKFAVGQETKPGTSLFVLATEILDGSKNSK